MKTHKMNTYVLHNFKAGKTVTKTQKTEPKMINLLDIVEIGEKMDIVDEHNSHSITAVRLAGGWVGLRIGDPIPGGKQESKPYIVSVNTIPKGFPISDVRSICNRWIASRS